MKWFWLLLAVPALWTSPALAAERYVLEVDGLACPFCARDGRFLRKWGGPLAMNVHGPFNGWFAAATDVAVDAAGNVLVADFYNDRVQKFSADGTFLTSFSTSGGGKGEFRYPSSLSDSGGRSEGDPLFRSRAVLSPTDC